LLLGLDIRREKLLELVSPSGAPGIERSKHLLELGLGVDAARVDREARILGRKAALCLGETAFVPDQIHQVGRVLAIVNRKSGIEVDLVGIFAKQPRADAVESACPTERICHDAGIVAKNLASNPLDALRHLGRSAARERHQENTPRISTAD